MTRSELDWLNSYHQLCRDRYFNIMKPLSITMSKILLFPEENGIPFVF
jgi:hypothetical protein